MHAPPPPNKAFVPHATAAVTLYLSLQTHCCPCCQGACTSSSKQGFCAPCNSCSDAVLFSANSLLSLLSRNLYPLLSMPQHNPHTLQCMQLLAPVNKSGQNGPNLIPHTPRSFTQFQPDRHRLHAAYVLGLRMQHMHCKLLRGRRRSYCTAFLHGWVCNVGGKSGALFPGLHKGFLLAHSSKCRALGMV